MGGMMGSTGTGAWMLLWIVLGAGLFWLGVAAAVIFLLR